LQDNRLHLAFLKIFFKQMNVINWIKSNKAGLIIVTCVPMLVYSVWLANGWRQASRWKMAVALVCLFGKRIWLQVGLVLWLAAGILAYGFGLAESGVRGGFNGYSGILSEAFGVSHRMANGLLEMTVLYWLLGGLVFSAWGWWDHHRPELAAVVKMACPACEGHLEFPGEAAGRTIACPHCQKEITLAKP
jgi:hypothetical protein